MNTAHHEPTRNAAPFPAFLVADRARPALMPLSESWDALADRLTVHEEREAKDGAGIVCAEFLAPQRRAANVAACTALVLDIEGKDADDLPPPPDEVSARLRRLNLEGVVYTSHNHLTPPEMNNNKPASPRYRVIAPLAAPIQPAELARQTDALAAALGLSAWLDPASRTVSQFFYLPSCRPGAERFAERIHGEPWDAAAPLSLPEHQPSRGGSTVLDFTPLPPPSGERGFDAVRKAAQGQSGRSVALGHIRARLAHARALPRLRRQGPLPLRRQERGRFLPVLSRRRGDRGR